MPEGSGGTTRSAATCDTGCGCSAREGLHVRVGRGCSPSRSAPISWSSTCSTRCSSVCCPSIGRRHCASSHGSKRGQGVADFVRRVDAAVSGRTTDRQSFAYPAYVAMRDRTNSFGDLFLFSDQGLTVGMAGRDERAPTLVVTGNFARALGVNTRSAGRSSRKTIVLAHRRRRAHPRGMATAVRQRSRAPWGDHHDQRRTRCHRRHHAAEFYTARAGIARRHDRAHRPLMPVIRTRPQGARKSEVLGLSRHGPGAAGCRRCGSGPNPTRCFTRRYPRSSSRQIRH